MGEVTESLDNVCCLSFSRSVVMLMMYKGLPFRKDTALPPLGREPRRCLSNGGTLVMSVQDITQIRPPGRWKQTPACKPHPAFKAQSANRHGEGRGKRGHALMQATQRGHPCKTHSRRIRLSVVLPRRCGGGGGVPGPAKRKGVWGLGVVHSDAQATATASQGFATAREPYTRCSFLLPQKPTYP